MHCVLTMVFWNPACVTVTSQSFSAISIGHTHILCCRVFCCTCADACSKIKSYQETLYFILFYMCSQLLGISAIFTYILYTDYVVNGIQCQTKPLNSKLDYRDVTMCYIAK